MHSQNMLYVEMNQTALLVIGNNNEWQQFLNHLKASKVTTNVAAEELAREYLKAHYHRNENLYGSSSISSPNKGKERKRMERYHQYVHRIMKPKLLAIQTRKNISKVVQKYKSTNNEHCSNQDTMTLSENRNLRAFCVED